MACGAAFHCDTEIFFARCDGPVTARACYVRVTDADRLHACYRERGVEVVEPLESKPWGMRGFAVRDPDGHVFRFGHGEKTVDEIPRFGRAQ